MTWRSVLAHAFDPMIALMRVVGWILGPFRLGRLFRAVSLPRMEEHGLRTALTLLGVSLGVAVLIAVAHVNTSVLESVKQTVGDIAGKADLQIGSGLTGMDESAIDLAREVPGVARVAPTLEQTATLADPAAKGERLLVLGIDLLGTDDTHFRSYASPELAAIRRDPLPFLNSSTNIIITRSVAKRFGYAVHDTLKLTTAAGVKDFEIWGILENEGVGSAFGGSVGIMYYPAMQVAFDRGRNVDRIDIAVDPASDASAVQAALRDKLGQGAVVERPDRKPDRVSRLLLSMRTVLLMASAIALFVGMFLIFNTISIGIAQRKREIAMLRALGSTRRDVMRLLTMEGFVLGVTGSALGVVLGAFMSRVVLAAATRAINSLFMQLAGAGVQFSVPLLVGGFLGGVVATTLTAAFAARQSASIRPAQALAGRAGTWSVHEPRPLLVVLAAGLIAGAVVLVRLPNLNELPVGAYAASGLVLCAGALLIPSLVWLFHRALAGVGLRRPEARLANGNLSRDLPRTSTTAGALMVGLAMATSFASLVGSFIHSCMDWIDQLVPADLLVTSGAKVSGFASQNVPLSDAFGGELAALPGVDRFERMRFMQIDYQGYTLRLLAVDRHDRVTSRLVEGDPASFTRRVQGGAVYVSESFSRRFDVHPADLIELHTGRGDRRFEVAGVFVDYQSDLGTIAMDRSTYIEGWEDTRVDTYALYLARGADLESVRRGIYERFGSAYDLFVLTNREFKAEFVQRLNQMFSIMSALEIVAILIAALGVINALLSSVLDRVRELGVLRAVGMLRRQVHRMITTEAVLIGCIGSLAGLLVGLALGFVLVRYILMAQSGFYLAFRPDWSTIAQMFFGVIVASGFAGWYPARQTTKLAIVDALDFE